MLIDVKSIEHEKAIRYNESMPKSQLKVEEKRAFYRHPIHVPMRLNLSDKKATIESQSSDISLGGLSFLWRDKLGKGNLLNLSIPVKEKLFHVRAKVVYSKEDRKTGRFKTGVSFYDLPSAFKAKLAEEALEILEYRKLISEELGRDVSEEEAAEKWIQKFASSF